MIVLRLLVVVFSLVVTLPRAVSADGTPVPPPDDWQAHAPIHTRAGVADNIGAPTGYTPDQIRHAYGIDHLPYDGSNQVIGIIDASDAPTVANDLQTFISTFGQRNMNGLPGTPACTVATGPHPCFQKIYAQGPPRLEGGWLLETLLDVQWAHAIAPGADILLVEAKTNTLSSLFHAADVAADGGARVVSMSWGAPERANEHHFDNHFQRKGVTFVAASGDSGSGVNYPAASPYVLSVGGTTLPVDGQGNLTGSETAWGGSGGGISAYEDEPAYQTSYDILNTGGKRAVPDVAYDADPSTGVSVYGSTLNQGQPAWFTVGGTSIGPPQWAALIALASQRRGDTVPSGDSANVSIYKAATGPVYASNYRDITIGTNGACGSNCTATIGYDLVTGLGSPLADNLIPYIAAP